ncbi:MAG TPA: ABC transporter ATP-binding protein [Candidatus Avacidaminococcus intestinavium]|uniref:ABC transporter ATP-binding protein n=1 Tax=Candidatus Avacidaminococcus intestinavium TaxID=2840684 RepID=A0A9D1MPB5_9FIRM|nr:ABC transporter ATP-binding protein [Candidatus Avacidaminococcus intestinavium]
MSNIYIKNLTKYYGKKVGINDINITLPDGKLTAIVGPSGCGKTTLLRTIAGFYKPDIGQIYFDERDVTNVSPQKRNVSMVFQQYALWPHLSVFDNIAYGLKLQKISMPEIENRVVDILTKVELDTADVKKRKPQEYSGGQQQRIALARSLVVQPKVLLMDEPLSNLDAKVRVRLRLEIKRIQESFGITTAYVTHDQEEALSMADHIVIMNNGIVEQTAAPHEIYEKPKTLFAAKFMGESHLLSVRENDKELVYVIRSREAQFLPNGQDVPTTGLNRPATIVKQLYMGAYCRYMLDVDGVEIFVDAPVGYEDNLAGHLYVPQQFVHVFHKEEQSECTG